MTPSSWAPAERFGSPPTRGESNLHRHSICTNLSQLGAVGFGPRCRSSSLARPACATRVCAPRSGALGGPGGVRKGRGETSGEPRGFGAGFPGGVPATGTKCPSPVVSPACFCTHLPKPFPTTLSGSPWGGRVVGNSAGSPPQGVFAGRRDNGAGRRPHSGHTPGFRVVRPLCGRCMATAKIQR